MISTRSMWLIVQLLSFLICPAKPSICPEPKFGIGVSLAWSQDLATLAFGCAAQYTELNCCAEGYQTLLWYQKQGNKWEPVWTNYQRSVENHNQTFVLKAASQDTDDGDFKCVATDDRGNNIANIVTLKIQECPNWHSKPVVFQPETNGTKYEIFPDEDIAITCSAFFGNCDNTYSVCFIDWLKVFKNGSTSIISEGNSSNHVYVERYSDFQNTGQKNLLHIQHIKMEDYGRYKCYAYTARGYESRVIFIAQKIKPLPWTMIASIISGVSVVGIVVAILAVRWKKGLEIKLWYKEKYKKRSRDEAKEYDAAILYTDASVDDKEFVETTLYETLTDELGYKIFISRDILYNESVWNAYGEAEAKSHCFIFVTSPEFFADKMCLNFFDQTVETQRRNFIFVKYKPLPKEEHNRLSENPEHKSIFTAMKVGRRFEWPQLNKNGERDKKKLDRFWKELRYELPAKVKEDELNNAAAVNHQPQPDDIEAHGDQPVNGGPQIRNRANHENRRNLNKRESGRPLLRSIENDDENLPGNGDGLRENVAKMPEIGDGLLENGANMPENGEGLQENGAKMPENGDNLLEIEGN